MKRFFDAHCDTISLINEKNCRLDKNSLHIDLDRMKEYDCYIQVFAAFIDKEKINISPIEHCLKLIERYKKEIKDNFGSLSAIENAGDLEKASRGGCHCILSIEGGEALCGSLDAVKMFYKLGVRLITLTWNYTNELADGIGEKSGRGLTEFGREAVKLMEELGIVIDVSHLSERGFWDVAEITKYPFVASHSCSKKICNHKRNLDDRQILEIINRRGCIGINFFPEFLSSDRKCKSEKILEHIEYILNLGGENSVGLGSDFDGVSRLPQNISGIESMRDIPQLLLRGGLSEEQTDKILFKNFYRVFYETMRR